jgi:hypothetical protein
LDPFSISQGLVATILMFDSSPSHQGNLLSVPTPASYQQANESLLERMLLQWLGSPTPALHSAPTFTKTGAS